MHLAGVGGVVVLVVMVSGCAARLNDLTPVEAARVAPEWLEKVEPCTYRYRYEHTDGRWKMLYRCEDVIVVIDVETGEVTTHKRLKSAGD
jgi:hypothetical protein